MDYQVLDNLHFDHGAIYNDRSLNPNKNKHRATLATTSFHHNQVQAGNTLLKITTLPLISSRIQIIPSNAQRAFPFLLASLNLYKKTQTTRVACRHAYNFGLDHHSLITAPKVHHHPSKGKDRVEERKILRPSVCGTIRLPRKD
jgi:hypothetical protein